MAQNTPLKFFADSGRPLSEAEECLSAVRAYRQCFSHQWDFNPWTGARRADKDIESDPWGKLIVPPGEDVAAAQPVDAVNHPAHYTAGGVECIDAIAAATTGLEGIEAACTANAIKYLWRWKRKNGAEDLRKARWYINHLLGEN